ncbi:MAG: choice-of-anchor G family protein [Jatrophihabitans sp.]|nr:MAG: choice-of-anchor G family protein [Jatrophihabitans sp.]
MRHSRSHSTAPRPPRRSRKVRVLAAACAAAVSLAGVSFLGGSGATAATTPDAQSAGNFVDALLGGQPLDSVLKLDFAQASAPGATSTQNPLDVTALDAVNLPLTGALQLPQILGISLGAANQVALARTDGQSFGGAGAVSNSGGVSVGGAPASQPPAGGASIDLTAAGLAGNNPVPVPGGTSTAAALGGVTVQVGAVDSVARTPAYGPALGAGWPANCTDASSTCYRIAGLDLSAASPLLGGTLAQVLTSLNGTLSAVVGTLTTAVGASGPLPAACTVTAPATLSLPALEGGSITVGTDGTIAVSLDKLLTFLGLDINDLPPNTDLLDYLLTWITSPAGLNQALQDAVNGLLAPLQQKFSACLTGLQNDPVIGGVAGLLNTLTGDLTTGQTQVGTTISDLVTAIAAAGGANPLAPIATALKQLVDLGVNVQPTAGPPARNPFTSKLNSLPKYNMTPPAVPYANVVRAVEIHLIGDPAAVIGLANSAAGPSSPAAPPSSSVAAAETAAANAVPNAVPAGQAVHGNPVAPIVLLIVGLALAAAGGVAWRLHGRHG